MRAARAAGPPQPPGARDAGAAAAGGHRGDREAADSAAAVARLVAGAVGRAIGREQARRQAAEVRGRSRVLLYHPLCYTYSCLLLPAYCLVDRYLPAPCFACSPCIKVLPAGIVLLAIAASHTAQFSLSM